MDRLPEQWMELDAYERDVLLALSVHAPIKGVDLWPVIGQVRNRETKPHMYDRVSDLRDRGLVESEALDGRTKEYDLSDAGEERVEAVKAILWDVATA